MSQATILSMDYLTPQNSCPHGVTSSGITSKDSFPVIRYFYNLISLYFILSNFYTDIFLKKSFLSIYHISKNKEVEYIVEMFLVILLETLLHFRLLYSIDFDMKPLCLSTFYYQPMNP